MAKRRDLPSFKSLQAFDAAARYLSFAKAAADLNVTPSAISHQIRVLETWLGCPLFHRSRRPMQLTQDGVLFAGKIASSLDAIEETGRQIRGGNAKTRVTIATMDSFATSWLIPRLQMLSPTSYDVHIEVDDRFIDLEHGQADMAIRYGNGKWPELCVTHLFDDLRVAVCSPSLEVDLEAEFRSSLLLHDGSRIGWDAWRDAASPKRVDDSGSGLYFSRSHLATQAARAGRGVTLASLPLVIDDLTSGELKLASKTSIHAPGAYYLLKRKKDDREHSSRALSKWIIEMRDESLKRFSVWECW